MCRAGYFAAGAAALLFASARRSVFRRRVARFLTLSWPLLCPMRITRHALPRGHNLFLLLGAETGTGNRVGWILIDADNRVA